MALLIPAVGEPSLVKPAHGRAFTLKELQGLVGGYLEAFPITVQIHEVFADRQERVRPNDLCLFLNEDGKRLQLPYNYRATLLLRGRLMPDDFIVGDVVVCTRQEAGEDDEA